MNFAVDSASLQKKDAIKAVAIFLDGAHDVYSRVDSKNFIKNDRYQFIWGSCTVTLGNWTIDCCVLAQVGMLKDFIVPKYFASDNKVEIIIHARCSRRLTTH